MPKGFELVQDLELASKPKRLSYFELVGLLIYLGIIVYKGYLCEDAFINLIHLNNFHEGFYLSALPDVRTLSATSPLWLLLELLTWTLFPGSLNAIFVLSIILSLGAAILGLRLLKSYFPASNTYLYLFILSASTIYTDYSTSGLENPLMHFLTVLMLMAFFEVMRQNNLKSYNTLLFFASLMVLTRFDLSVLICPVVLLATWQIRHLLNAKTLMVSIFSIFPIFTWLVFSLFYYADFLPETYYAKAESGLPLVDKIPYGLLHNIRLLDFDPLAVFVVFFLVMVSLLISFRRLDCNDKLLRTAILPLSIGIVLYQVYFHYIGGDYMLGRFNSVSTLIAALFFAPVLGGSIPGHFKKITCGSMVFILGLFGLFNLNLFVPRQDLTSDTGIVRAGTFDIRLFSENWYFLSQDHESQNWRNLGLQKAVEADSSKFSIPYVGIAAGVIPYYAGPKSRFIDSLGLTDPLIARLPCKSISVPGHCEREIPNGYQNFVQGGTFSELDANLAQYANLLYQAKSGNVISIDSLRKSFNFAVGKHDYLLKLYNDANKSNSYSKGSNSEILGLLFDQTILRGVAKHFYR